MKKLALPFFLLFLLVILLNSGIRTVDAVTCRAVCPTCKGRCYMSSHCALKCVAIGFNSGKCMGVISRKCYCFKDCSGGGYQPPGGGYEPPGGGYEPPGGGYEPPGGGYQPPGGGYGPPGGGYPPSLRVRMGDHE